MYSLFKDRAQKKTLKFFNPEFAYIIYPNRRQCLISKKVYNGGIHFLKSKLDSIKANSYLYKPIVFHLYYELGFVFQNLDLIGKDDILGIVIKYKDSCYTDFSTVKINKISLKSKPSFESYKKQFIRVQERLISGDAYQLNLTRNFKFSFKENTEEEFLNHFFSKKSLSPFAHATFIPSLNQLIMSNSPECLFTIKEKKIYSMPIKGTIKEDEKGWNDLVNSKKDEGELFMISDLIRNDLTHISMIPSRVIHKKEKLKVPKIWHQYSLIEGALLKDTTLLDVISKIFPGGSITGAPKKNALKLLHEIEDSKREIYCGSTVVFHKSFRSASINIRTAHFDFNKKEISYGSGGGVTCLSKTNDEYEEMLLKTESFLSILN